MTFATDTASTPVRVVRPMTVSVGPIEQRRRHDLKTGWRATGPWDARSLRRSYRLMRRHGVPANIARDVVVSTLTASVACRLLYDGKVVG